MQVSFFFSTRELPLHRASGVTVPGCFGCPAQCSAAGMEPWSPDRACPPPGIAAPTWCAGHTPRHPGPTVVAGTKPARQSRAERGGTAVTGDVDLGWEVFPSSSGSPYSGCCGPAVLAYAQMFPLLLNPAASLIMSSHYFSGTVVGAKEHRENALPSVTALVSP